MGNEIHQIKKKLNSEDKEYLLWFFDEHIEQVVNDVHRIFDYIYKYNKYGYKEIHGLECTVCKVSTEMFSDKIKIIRSDSTSSNNRNRRKFKFRCECGFSSKPINVQVFSSKILIHIKDCELDHHEIPLLLKVEPKV